MNVMESRNAQRLLGVAEWVAALLVLVTLGYGAAGLIGAMIPRNAGWRAPADGVEIFTLSERHGEKPWVQV